MTQKRTTLADLLEINKCLKAPDAEMKAAAQSYHNKKIDAMQYSELFRTAHNKYGCIQHDFRIAAERWNSANGIHTSTAVGLRTVESPLMVDPYSAGERILPGD